MPSANELSDVLHVPLESSNRTWQQNLSKYRAFYLAKKTYGDPKLNLACRAFDMFQDNQNASRLIRALDVDTWVAFGNGFDLCVNAAASGILKTGAKLIVLSDIRISSASGTPESEKATMAALVNAGAKVMLFDDLRAILN
jgi:nicotinamidase-related amidase